MSWLVPAALLLALQDPTGRPVVGVEVQPQSVAVGEPFTVRVRVRAAAGTVIRFPAVPDSSGSVEAVDPRAIEDRSTSTVFDQTATYRFIAWEPGRRAVPLGGVRWEHGRTADTLAVGRLRVEVTSLLPADTAEQVPRPARAPLDPVPPWWRWALIAAGVLAIALMSWRAWRKRGTAGAAPLDAYADAQAGFAAVDALALVEAGEPGRAVLAYADVMRAYLTRRFPQATDGLITSEYAKALADSALPILPEEVADVLETADAVKFAAAPVDAEGVARVARGARGVVRDVQVAYEARLAAADKGKGPRGRRRAS
ncbi:MAG: hypothetical protein WC700_06090 [Gemmatimonadaceae bacterium]|jgi:hypothetical protein